jgi:hypothetical protein
MLQGKGMSIWKIAACEGGNAQAMVKRAKDVGIRHVHIKVADGVSPSNNQPAANSLLEIVAALREAGVEVWGWHFLYGTKAGQVVAAQEADRAVKQIRDLGLDGYALDFENTGNPQFSWNGGPQVARTFMTRMRDALGPDFPIGAKSHALMFKFGTDDKPLQPAIPFDAFVQDCNYLIPQIYWVFDTPDRRFRESYRQYSNRYPGKPFVPYGAAYGEKQPNGKFWEASPEEITRFMQLAQELNFPACAFYSWDYCSSKNPGLWMPIAAYAWQVSAAPGPASPPPSRTATTQPISIPPPAAASPADVPAQFIAALNARNVDSLMALFAPEATHVTAQRTTQRNDQIRDFYAELLNRLPAARFALTSVSEVGPNSIQFNWTAANDTDSITDGNDTIGVMEGRITYHTTVFSFAMG